MAFEFDYYYRWNERIVADAVALNASNGAVSEILTTNLTPNRLLLSDASGKIIVSSLITTTEAEYLDGVTSNIQTQLNAKQATLTLGNLTELTSSVLTIVGATGAIIGSGLTIQVKLAGAGQSGYLSTTDWNTFNNKLTSTLTSAYVFVGNGSNVATGVAVSGDITMSNAGVVAIASGVIVDADVNASAAITRSKTAAGTAYRILANNVSGVMSENAAITASRAVVSDANGQLVHATTTATQIGYSSTLTADIQVQLDTLILGHTTNTILQNPTVTQHGFAITWDNTAGELTLTDPVVQGIPAAGTANYALIKNSGTDYDASWTAITLSHVSDVSALVADVNILAGGAAAGVTATEFQYLNGVTSAIQTQLDAKQSSSLAQNAVWVGNASNIAAQLSSGTTGYVLTSVSGVPQWQPPSTISDGDKGDIIISGSGATYTIDNTITKAWTGTHSFLDNGFTLLDNADNTKILAFQLSGITTATTRTITIPDASGTLAYNPMTTGGDIVYGGASGVPTRLANGSAGQVLTSAGTTLAPTWSSIGGLSGLTTDRIPIAASATSLTDTNLLKWVSGSLIIGGSSGSIGGSTILVAQSSANISAFNYVNSATGSFLSLGHNRNTTPGSHTTVQNGDDLGTIAFYADDGTTFQTGAYIKGLINGSVSTNVIPTALHFQTTTGNSPTTRIIISPAGLVGVGIEPTHLLHVAGISNNQNLFLVEENGGGNILEIVETAGVNAIGFFGVSPVGQATTLTTQLTSIVHTAPGTPDYLIQNLTNVAPYGFVTQDEGNSVLSVIQNLQTRLDELEGRLQDYGLLA